MNPNGQPDPRQTNNPPQQPPAGPPPAPGAPQQPAPAPNSWQPLPQQNNWQQPAQQQGWAPRPDPNAIPPQAGPAAYSADYLDQIAPSNKRSAMFSGSFTWIIVGMAVLFMFAVGIIAISGDGNNTTVTQTAYLRLVSLVSVNDSYRKYIKSSKLSATNTNFKIFMSGSQTDLKNALAKSGVPTEKLNKELKAKEKTTIADLTKRIEEGRLNAIMDRSYSREMAYQAQLLIDMYTKMSKSPNADIANAGKKAIPNLQPIQKSFADFNDTED